MTRGQRSPGVWLEAGGRPALSLHRVESSNENYRWRARLVGRSDGGFNVGMGATPAAAIADLIGKYRECVADVEAGRDELDRLGQLAPARRRRGAA